jgi:Flp pilus assembly protein TadG
MFTRMAARARSIYRSEDGAVAIQMALIMVVLIGMGALAIDIGYALSVHRKMQVAADTAAFSAAIAKKVGYPAITTEAYGVAAQNGFVNGSNSVTVSVYNPPHSPPATAADAANASAVQVIVQQPQTLPLVGAVCALLPGQPCSGTFTVAAQAVAITGTPGGGGGCASQLLPGVNPGVTISNGAAVTLKGCGMSVCSTGNTALSLSGGAGVKVYDQNGTTLATGLSGEPTVSVAGKASITNGATINNVPNVCAATSACKQNQGGCPGADPYAAVTMPTMPGGCSNGTAKNYTHSNSGLQTLNPGVWCNGVSFTNDAQIKLNPGVYFVNGGTFSVGGAVQMTGTGVTIVLTGSSSNGYAIATIGNGSTVTLSAPTSGATSGIAFFGDRNAPNVAQNNSTNFGGGANMDITGAFYFPSQTTVFQDGISNPTGCTQLIAGAIVFQGGSQFSNNCAGTGTNPIGAAGTSTAFVE